MEVNNNVVYQIVGQPLGVFYLPHCKGLVEDGNGHYRYDIEDLDRNGTVDLSDGGDRYIAGQATPKVTLGSNVSFRYRDWYLSLQMNGAFGHRYSMVRDWLTTICRVSQTIMC